MFHVGRCGSTVLAMQLAQHPDIRWGGELFEGLELQAEATEPRRGLQRSIIIASACKAPVDYFGLEIKAIHFTRACLGESIGQFVDLLRDIGVRQFVVLRRDNLLRVVVSSLIGHRQATWHATREQDAQERIELNPADPWGNGAGSLLETFSHYERYYQTLDELLDHPLRLSYESDVEQDPGVGYRRVCAALSVVNHPVKVTLRRTNPFPLQRLLSNFDEVRQYLQGSDYAWMADA